MTANASRVLHANLLYRNRSIETAIEELAGVDADVIALSELTPEFAAVATSRLQTTHPHTCVHAAPKALGLGIWSSRPLGRAGPVPAGELTLEAAIDLDGSPLRLVLTHPVPAVFNVPGFERELRALAAAPPDVHARTAYVGDFNVSYFHPPYRRLLRRLRLTDAHHLLGRGFSVSWPTHMMVPGFVRLDHVAVGDQLTVTDLADLDVTGSDHRAFVVTVAWRDRAG